MNSDLELCTESKLSRVHQVHSLNPSCAHRPRALRPSGRVAAVLWVVSQPVVGLVAGLTGSVVAVSQAWPALSQARPLPLAHCAPCRTPSAVSYASCAVSWRLPGHVAALYHDTTSYQASPCHDTTDCIMTYSPTTRPCARTAAHPRA